MRKTRMGRTLAAAAALLALGLTAGCQSALMVKSTAATHTPAEGKAQVVFLRPSTFGGAIQSSVYDASRDADDRFIGIVSAKTKVGYTTTPGHHLFMVIAENADFLEADLDAGKTYYVLVSPRPGWWKARFSLLPVRSADGAERSVKSEDFAKWMTATQWVDLTAQAELWYREHAADVREKKLDYLKKWDRMDASDKAELTLQAGDGV